MFWPNLKRWRTEPLAFCDRLREERFVAISRQACIAYARQAGYGSKLSTVELGREPVQFRLLADGLLGYMWPKWVRSR